MITEKTYITALTIDHAFFEAKKCLSGFRYIAGGTDVIVNKFQGNDNADCLIDISGIAELKQVVTKENHIEIGALVRLDDLKNYKVITDNFPALLEAANLVASPVIRKTATIGGNLLCENRCVFYNQSEWWREAAGHCLKCNGNVCIASGGNKNCFAKFVSDTAVVLISMNASIEVFDDNKLSIIPIEEIYSGDGIIPVKLSKLAIVKSIHIPLNNQYKSVFKKLRQRETLEFSSMSTAVTINKIGKLKIVLGAVHAKPIIFNGNVTDDFNEILNALISNTRIVDNDVYSRSYRKEMISVFLQRSFKELSLLK
ncbi:MAG: FAD binding domain-containing protein [Bacteroidia bacterium]|nr:FAD binding domain-containing protein [Bacteroidia bacterium]